MYKRITKRRRISHIIKEEFFFEWWLNAVIRLKASEKGYWDWRNDRKSLHRSLAFHTSKISIFKYFISLCISTYPTFIFDIDDEIPNNKFRNKSGLLLLHFLINLNSILHVYDKTSSVIHLMTRENCCPHEYLYAQ